MFWSCNNIYFDNLLVWYCNVTIFTYHINIEFIFDIFTIHSPFTKCDAWFQKEYNTHSFKYQNNFSCYVYFQHVLWFFFVILYFTRQNQIIRNTNLLFVFVCILYSYSSIDQLDGRTHVLFLKLHIPYLASFIC